MLLGEILIRQGKLTPEGLAAALEQQRTTAARQPVGALLVSRGMVSEADLLAALAEQYGCDSVETVGDDVFDAELVARLPVEWARTQGMLPIRWKGRPAVLSSDPSAFAARDDLAVLLRCELNTVLAPRTEIAKAIERFYFRRQDSAEDLLRGMEAEHPAAASPRLSSADDLLRVADQAPVTQLVNVVLLEALKARASDVHVEPCEKTLRIRYRIDGLLYEQASPPKDLESAFVSRLKVMAHLDIAEKRLPQDGTARVRVGDREIDIRVSTIPVGDGERVVLRLLHRESALLPLEQLGMPVGVLTSFRAILREPHGVVLVTGPTGSGKTTTLYSTLNSLAEREINITTIEDPIELMHEKFNQIAVQPGVGLTFAMVIKHIVRQSADVIMVGEIRDQETAENAFKAALTGHLVISTLHTNDAPSAVIRLTDMGVHSSLLESALVGVVSQRLVRKVCNMCGEPYRPSQMEFQAMNIAEEELVGLPIRKGCGCQHCRGTGYLGRTAVFEIMPITDGVKLLVHDNMAAHLIRKAAIKEGMRTLQQSVMEKFKAGITTSEEVIRIIGGVDLEAVSE